MGGKKGEGMVLMVKYYIYWFLSPGWAINVVFGIHLLCDINRFLKLENNIKSSITFCFNVFIALLIEKELTL